MTQHFDETTLQSEGFKPVDFRIPVWTAAPGAKVRGYVLDQRKASHGTYFVMQLTAPCEARDLLGHEGAPRQPRHIVAVYALPELGVLKAMRVAYQNARIEDRAVRVPVQGWEVVITVDDARNIALQTRKISAQQAQQNGQPIVQEPPEWIEPAAPPWEPRREVAASEDGPGDVKAE